MTLVGDFETAAAANVGEFQPVLEIDLTDSTAFGGDDPPPWWDTTLRLSGGIAYARGYAYNPCVIEWGDIPRGFDAFASALDPLEVTVTIADPNDVIRGSLDSGANQRGSAARIYYVLPGNADDYQVLFVGILERWGYKSGHVVNLTLRTDDAILRKYVPAWAITKSEWPNAPTSSVGLLPPIIYGTHNSSGLSGTGMLTAIPVNWTASTTGWYVVCAGEAKEVLTVYNNGTAKTITTHYTLDYSLSTAGRVYTVIKFTAGNIPAAEDVITCDVSGYETTGNTGATTTAPTGSLLINPVEQMRHFLLNFVEMDYKAGAWSAFESSAKLHADSWAAAAQWAEQHILEGTGFIGGAVEAMQAWDVLNEWLDSWPMFRAYWTASGELGLAVVGLDFPGYRTSSDPPLFRSEHDLGDAEYEQMTDNLTDSISASYLYDEVQGKFLATLAVIDPDAGSEIASAVNLKWSVRRAV